MQRESKQLPDGVQRTFAQVMRAKQVRAGGGFHFYLVPRFVLPRGWEPGLMKHRIRTTEKRWTSQGPMLIDTKARSVEHRTELGWHGLRSEEVTTAVTQGPGATPNELLVSARTMRNHADGPRITRTLLKPLSEAFHLDLGTAVGSWKRTAEVEVCFRLPLSSLGVLQWPTLDNSTTSPKCAQRYARNMRRARSVEERAAMTQRFLQKKGLAGAAALWRMAGRPVLRVGANDPFYVEALERARKVRLLHACRHGTHCAAGYDGRQAVKKGLDTLDVGLRRLAHERLLPDTYKQQLSDAFAHERRALLALPH